MQKFSRVLTIFFVCLVASAAWGARVLDRSVVVVNDEIILESDVKEFVNNAKSKSFQELFGGIDQESLKDPDNVLRLLVEERIIDQQVKKLELQAAEKEIDGQIGSILTRNNITSQQLEMRLKQLGTSMADYRKGIKRQIERRALIEREIRPSLQVTEKQMQHFFERQSDGKSADLLYRISHILVEGNDAKRVQKISKEVTAKPEKFADLAKEYSDDTSTAETGGDLGYVSQASMAPEFKAVVMKTPVGKITKPVKTAAGFHIIKVVETKTPDYSTLTPQQKNALRQEMIASELEKKMGLWLERKRAEAHIVRSSGTPTNKTSP